MEQVLPETKNIAYIHQEVEWQTPLEKNILAQCHGSSDQPPHRH